MRFFKKHFVLPLSVVIFCAIAGTILFCLSNAKRLDSFTYDYAVQMLENNPLELHYSIAYPEKMGLGNISSDLIPFNEKYYANGKRYWQACAENFSQIKPSLLAKQDRYLYNLLDRHIGLQLKSLDFPYYENPLSCSGGVHSQLPILLSEYIFRSKEDIENYFVLLSQIPAYLDGLYQYAYAQELNGLGIFKGSLEEVSVQCLELFPMEQLHTQTHFLQSTFSERLQSLTEQGLITSEECSDYEKRNTILLKNEIAPAYKRLSESISRLKGKETLSGLSSYPKGKAYYELLLQANTGSSRSLEEIKNMLYERYDSLYQSYKTLLQKNTFIQNFNFPITSHKEMLEHLYAQAQTNFPPLHKLGIASGQRVQLKHVNGILADMSAPAFYMTPPIDDNDTHMIYINPSAEMKTLDLYTTLAHEGFPGHLYQTVYSQTFLDEANAPLVRQLLYYGGFTEGWAVYAELYAYQFAANACDEKAKDTLLLTQYNREMQLCICSILDIYVHYEGANLQQVKDLLASLGLNSSGADTLYQVICDAPANYPKYYVGYLEILHLKELAEKTWKENYSDYAFHKWLLETGGGDYKNLEELLK